MRAAYHDPDPLRAEATLEALARSLDKAIPALQGRYAKAWPRPSP
jgi:hypothetical protein